MTGDTDARQPIIHLVDKQIFLYCIATVSGTDLNNRR